jgi:hypothetical protein
MSDRFHDKHLLWWVLKAVDKGYATNAQNLLDEDMWKMLGADTLGDQKWLIPAIKEKYADLKESGDA